MTRRPILVATTASIASLCITNAAHANVISPFVYFWPGVVSITIVYAFPASLLAAFIERRWIQRAGVETHPLAASLQANLVTTIIGLCLVPIGYPALYALGPVWCAIAFAVSCYAEHYYLRWAAGLEVDRKWIVVGNALSAGVLMILPPIAYAVGQYDYRLWWSMRGNVSWLQFAAFAISAFAFASSFAWRLKPSTTMSSDDIAKDSEEASEFSVKTRSETVHHDSLREATGPDV